MTLDQIGWMRPVLVVLITILSAALWFGADSLRLRGASRLHIDPLDIRGRTLRRLAILLMGWGGWVLLHIAAGLPESWLTTVWAPLVIVVTMSASYPALLVSRSWEAGSLSPEDRPVPARGGWVWVILREMLPLSTYLMTILVIRSHLGDIPDEVPVRWLPGSVAHWLPKLDALRVLRHQTMVAYLVLFLLEGAYLIVRWMMGQRGDIASRLLTRRHWLYFVFRVSWTVLFAGLNLGLVQHAVDGQPVLPYVLPGVAGLVGFAVLTARRNRQLRDGNEPVPERRS